MKVLVIHNDYQSRFIGGEDIVVSREIAGLKSYLGEKNVFEYRVSNDDIRPLKLAFSLWGNRVHYQNIYQWVVQHKINIVHVHNFFPLLTPYVFAAAKKAGAKVVHTLHNFRWWCLAGTLYRQGHCEKCVNKKWGYPAFYYRCYRRSWLQSLVGSLALSWYKFKKMGQAIDAYFVLSQFQKNKIIHYLPAEQLFLKPNPIDEPASLTDYKAKKDYLFVGRLEEAKGVEILLATWCELPEDFHLNLIGGIDNAMLQKKYQRTNIHFLGQLSNQQVLAKMAQAKYLLHTSLAYETFGLTIIEALAQGTPVIGFNIGTRAEFIESGKNGFLCQVSTLKETILNAQNDLNYPLLCQQAYESAKPYYLSSVISKQVAYYQRLIDL